MNNYKNNNRGPAFSDFVSEQKRRNKSSVRALSSFSWIAESVPIVALIIIFAFLFIRLFFLQIVQASYYKNLSENNRTRAKTITAARGIIFDRKDRPLVRNVPAYSIFSKDKSIHWLTEDEALRMIAKGEEADITRNVQREYVYDDKFAHVIGFIGQISEEEFMDPMRKDYKQSDFIGKMGIEKEYEIILKGEDGEQLYEVDAHGKIVTRLGSKEGVSGGDIKTTLDVDLQLAASEALKDTDKGAIIVSDPRDGSILALFSKPTFDPNLFTHEKNYTPRGDYTKVEEVIADSQNQPFLNRPISGTYPPGSVYKLVSAASALSSGAINEDTQFEDTGVLKVGDFSYGNWYFSQYGRKEGSVDIVKAIKRSNDIFFYKASQATGIEKLAATSHLFGLGDRLGIDIPGEEKGLVPDNAWKEKEIGEKWYLGDTFHVGIGQGFVLTTPLQVNMFTSIFANEGVLYKPHLLLGKTEILRKNIITQEHAEIIKKGMKQACEPGGTGWPLFDFKVKNPKLKIDNLDYSEAASAGAEFVKVSLACKTGTAETVEDKNSHAWITVFAPFYNPEVAVTVLIEHGGEGSTVAGPIAKQILEKYFEGK